jgi:DNA-binding transcriptional LysR family regulator
MSDPDFNLLIALDALLAERSVARAAQRLGLSASAMSRTLARLRDATGDPLLVRAGRGLVPTPRAAALAQRVKDLTQDVRAVLGPAPVLDIASLERVFVIRANDGFIDAFAARLVAALASEAPLVRLRFAPKPDKDVQPLREGLVDLEIGVLGETGPEMRVQSLFRDRFVAAVRDGHALLAQPNVTVAHYVAYGHVVTSRRGKASGPVDEALAAIGLVRQVVAVVASFPAALAIARDSDLIALVPERHIGSGMPGIRIFPLPVQTPPITVSQLWHPRQEADAAHRWLRGKVLFACRAPAMLPTGFASP